jgi:hypothetical protein
MRYKADAGMQSNNHENRNRLNGLIVGESDNGDRQQDNNVV